jgi:hypothetical protein
MLKNLFSLMVVQENSIVVSIDGHELVPANDERMHCLKQLQINQYLWP